MGKITIDSGAAESVMPWEMVPNSETLKETTHGKRFVAANGAVMRNYGKKTVQFKGNKEDRRVKEMEFYATEVKKPLASVARIVEAGNIVCFGPGESYIMNVDSGEKQQLQKENGTYVMPVEFLSVFSRQN